MPKSSSESVRKLMIATQGSSESFKFSGGGKYPGCFGKFPDCPEAAKEFAGRKNKTGFTKDDIPDACRLCPFLDW